MYSYIQQQMCPRCVRSWKLMIKLNKNTSWIVGEHVFLALTAKTSVNARLEGLESVTIPAASGVNERSTRLQFLVEVESLSRTGRARSNVDRLFTNRWITIVQNYFPAACEFYSLGKNFSISFIERRNNWLKFDSISWFRMN